ncbi:right-handed parallel beta-helix repeat-containing protein [Sphingomonas sp. IC-11]|uniref:right-handed parallel beta-helix repeat-containing protein n=1 Tax=Sphingomonas sp. IC-11 TaxID=2898528 RepID=UPI001E2DF428|nr:right-handed parallel beta-helix repeat-containing protein [Sphingomonas sp. IC-11]MCD2317283.1 right-handed parallel beta-helix repeat-containing protein [Sphingomonas sp. IC-11]
MLYPYKTQFAVISLLFTTIPATTKLDAEDTGSACFKVYAHPQRAEQALAELRSILAAGGRLCILVSGTFFLDHPLRLTSGNAGSKIVSAPGNMATFIGRSGASRGLEIIGADDVVVQSIKFSSFQREGVYAQNARRVTIRSVAVEDIRSNAWSQGAVHLTGVSTDALIENSTIDGADYAGIIIDTDATSDISGTRILNNRVQHSCRRIHDCGAIYVNDRGRVSRNIVIAGNVVTDFGPLSSGGRGIYLDDWASHVAVRNNYISGPGHFAFQIHGGRDNRITHNIVDMAHIYTALLYQAAAGSTRAAMMGNVVADNIFTRHAAPGPVFKVTDYTGAGGVSLRRNRQCIVKQCIPTCRAKRAHRGEREASCLAPEGDYTASRNGGDPGDTFLTFDPGPDGLSQPPGDNTGGY